MSREGVETSWQAPTIENIENDIGEGIVQTTNSPEKRFLREATKVVVGTHNLQTPVRFRAPQHVIGMKIYVLGSTSFMKEMVDATKELCVLGHDGWIHPHYEAFVRGEKPEHVARWQNGERAALKRENNYFREHYKNILESEAVLIVNLEKRGIENYIGGNVLMEMGQAYVNDKKIFFLNGMPLGLSYMDEIEAMDPICLQGDLRNILMAEG